jgi:hypothetical protein
MDGDNAGGASRPFEPELGRTIIPNLCAAIESNNEGRRGGLAKREAQMGAVNGFERADTAVVGRHLVIALDDLATDNAAVFGDGSMLTCSMGLGWRIQQKTGLLQSIVYRSLLPGKLRLSGHGRLPPDR